MVQEVDTQELLDTLEGVIQQKTSWYTPFKCDWDMVTYKNAVDTAGYYIFFPREITDIVPLDDSYKDKAAIARRWYRNFISEKDDDVVNIYEIYKTWPTLKDDIFQVTYNKEFIATCVKREYFKSNPQLQVEVNGLNHILFTSADMVERFVKRNCPLLSSCVERWKLLNELREYLQEIRVVRKQPLHT